MSREFELLHKKLKEALGEYTPLGLGVCRNILGYFVSESDNFKGYLKLDRELADIVENESQMREIFNNPELHPVADFEIIVKRKEMFDLELSLKNLILGLVKYFGGSAGTDFSLGIKYEDVEYVKLNVSSISIMRVDRTDVEKIVHGLKLSEKLADIYNQMDIHLSYQEVRAERASMSFYDETGVQINVFAEPVGLLDMGIKYDEQGVILVESKGRGCEHGFVIGIATMKLYIRDGHIWATEMLERRRVMHLEFTHGGVMNDLDPYMRQRGLLALDVETD